MLQTTPKIHRPWCLLLPYGYLDILSVRTLSVLALTLFDCYVGSKEEKKTSVLGFYEVTVPEVDGIGVLTLAKRAFSPDELGR
jgi:hypothetical protein